MEIYLIDLCQILLSFIIKILNLRYIKYGKAFVNAHLGMKN